MFNLPLRLSQHMPLRRQVQFLRDRARRLLEMAQHQTPLSDQLKVMAAELEAQADELEGGRGRRHGNG